MTTATGHEIGLRLTVGPRGTGELDLHCQPSTPMGDQVIFARYVDEHLRTCASDITCLRTYICPRCDTPVLNRDTARKRLIEGKHDIRCPDCEHRIPLWDDLERSLASPELSEAVERIRNQAQLKLDNESRERLLVGEVTAMAATANQLARELIVSDHGIDMELEFKDDNGAATGRKLYLQLKSGDSHLRARERDDKRVFRIKNVRHAEYWANQRFPVMLVIRDSAGTTEWMEISDALRIQRNTGKWPAREIVFDGERFDLMSIYKWRDRTLADN